VDIDVILTAINQLRGALERAGASGVGQGSILSTLRQLEVASERLVELNTRSGATPLDVDQLAQRLTQTLEVSVRGFILSQPRPLAGGRQEINVLNFNRVPDVLDQLGSLEVKAGAEWAAKIRDQLVQDLRAAYRQVEEEHPRPVGLDVPHFGPEQQARVVAILNDEVRDMLEKNFSREHILQVLSGVRITENSEEGLKQAFKLIFDENGLITRVALEEAGNSPNFVPAMEAVLGPDGKLAAAARLAAGETNLTTAAGTLEQKIEEGVGGAMARAGEKVSAVGAKELADKIGSGVTALGNVLTSIPALYDSVTKLGEAWDKPHRSTKDYLDLLGAAGGALTQFGSTIQSLVGVTQIFTAVQAVANAVMAANPVVLIVLAVVALIAAVVALIVYWDQVKAAIRDNPWVGVIVAMTGVIGLIILVIAYWDEIKLAALQAANFVSIQVQRIGLFFVGLKNLVGMVWDWITATVQNVGISIANAFIQVGTSIQNFFIGVINWVLGKYNALADSAAGKLAGLKSAELIPEVDVKSRLIPPKEVPQVSVDVAFAASKGPVTGGLEQNIAQQEAVIAQKAKEEEERKRAAAAAPGPEAAPGLPPGLPGAPALPPGAPALAGPPLPALPAGAGRARGPGQPVDQRGRHHRHDQRGQARGRLRQAAHRRVHRPGPGAAGGTLLRAAVPPGHTLRPGVGR
jgi:hypothetical protein